MTRGDQRKTQHEVGGWGRLDQDFDADTLIDVRTAVAECGQALGARGQHIEDLTIISSELASNAIRHGGGGGVLRLWRDGETIACQVTDAGPGMPDPDGAGTRRPSPAAVGGRGLWVVRQMSDRVDIRTGPGGTTVTVLISTVRTER